MHKDVRQEKINSFQKKIKQIMECEGLNLRQISDLTGLNYGSLKNYSSGARIPKLDQLKRIADHPRFKKYEGLLLETSDIDEDHALILSLYEQLQEAGKGKEAEDYLRYLVDREKKK